MTPAPTQAPTLNLAPGMMQGMRPGMMQPNQPMHPHAAPMQPNPGMMQNIQVCILLHSTKQYHAHMHILFLKLRDLD